MIETEVDALRAELASQQELFVSIMLEIALGVGMFTAIVLILVFVILLARAWLVASGNVTITVNGEATFEAPAGAKLADALSSGGLYVSTTCPAWTMPACAAASRLIT